MVVLVAGPAVGPARGQCATNELLKLSPAPAASGDCFGYALALRGDVAVIGARGLNSARGATFVFRFDGSTWNQEAMLTISGGAPNSGFGYAVAAGDGVLVATAPGARAAYVFRHDGSAWIQEAQLTGGDSVAGDDFGSAVALSGDTILVGAQSTNITLPGAGYVFRHDGTNWTQEAKLVAAGETSHICLGHSAALVGDLAMLGAEQGRVNGVACGAAYVYRRTGAAWTQAAKLNASDYESGGSFGHLVVIGEDRLLVSADADDNANGVNAGAVYVFRAEGASWTQETKLIEPGGADYHYFGSGAAVQGNLGVIGANDWNGVRGRAFVYTHDGAAWAPRAILTATDAYPQARVGAVASLSGDTLLLGAPGNYISGGTYGAAYVYRGLTDCQPNDVLDLCDIADGTSLDANTNGVPDECEGETVCAQWTPACLQARHYPTLAYDSARQVTVAFGGVDSAWGCPGDTWEWNGAQWTLRAIAGPGGRFGQTLAYDSVRAVCVLFGGCDANNNYLGDTWEWNGASWTQRAASGPSPRRNGAMTFDDARGVCVLYGGADSNGTLMGDTWEWDGTTWTQRANSGPAPRQYTAMAYDGRRHVSVLYSGDAQQDDTWEWDGATWTQRVLAGPGGRYTHAMTYDAARQVVLLWGGYRDGLGELGDSWEFDGSAWQLRATTGPAPRYGHGLAYDATRARGVLFGGYDYPSGPMYGDTWEWDGSAWMLKVPDSPEKRNGHVMAYDAARERTVLFGGYWYDTNYHGLNDTWEWDGVQWNYRTSTGPSARTYSAMVYDSGRNVTVLFGGWWSGDFRDTWEWNGNAWTLRSNDGPRSRQMHTLAYDAARGETLLFGGAWWDGSGYQLLGDTWAWNGQTWTQRATDGPCARRDARMSYDAERQKVVLFGGSDGVSIVYNDTWEWDGTQWRLIDVSNPPPRSVHALAYDAAAGTTVMFGGGGETINGDTWEWNGTAWTRRMPSDLISRIPARYRHAMAFDEVREECILFGGVSRVGDGSGCFSDTWAYANDSDSQILVGPPAEQCIRLGQTVTYHVEVQTTGDANFQWRRDGVNLNDDEWISGALSDTLTISDPQLADSGAYDVVVTDDCGPFGSAASTLVISPLGDLDCDGDVDLSDLAQLLAHYGMTAGATYEDGDLNGDGDVDLSDLAGLLGNYGAGL